MKEQGWRSGESTRLPPLWGPGFHSRTPHYMWVEFVLSLLSFFLFFFSGTSIGNQRAGRLPLQVTLNQSHLKILIANTMIMEPKFNYKARYMYREITALISRTFSRQLRQLFKIILTWPHKIMNCAFALN